MMPFVIIIVLQVVIAGVVIFVLKHLLNPELEKVAIEKLASLKPSIDVKVINVYHFRRLPVNIQKELRELAKNKFTNSEIIFEQSNILKGGVVIKIDSEVLDFSLSSRLENFWS
jgi:F0F1-type ATP synthase delta subunit